MHQIKLYYGFEEHECGTFHSFHAEAPNSDANALEIAQDLAEQLDCKVDDDHFKWRMMYINLPADLVAQIKESAVTEYLKNVTKGNEDEEEN